MISRSLVRRLEELESRSAPIREPLRFHVKYVDVQGNVVSSHVVEGPEMPSLLPARRWSSAGRRRPQLAAIGI